MKKLVIFIFLFEQLININAQTNSSLHHGTFKKDKVLMSSNSYKPDDWEKLYFDSSIKTAFPSDLNKFPEKYENKLVHLIGIVDSVYIDNKDSVATATFLLDNKYWDYIEDYSIQDEVIFVSEKGDGRFLVTLSNIKNDEANNFKSFASEKKLFLVYGIFKGSINKYPVISAQQIKYIDYELYTTNVFSYEVERDKKGNVETDKRGKIQMTNFKFLKVAKAGQNK